jgi:hypothetical protein
MEGAEREVGVRRVSNRYHRYVDGDCSVSIDQESLPIELKD